MMFLVATCVRRYKQALALYSMAVCKAPDGDDTVAYCVANRYKDNTIVTL